MDKNIRLKELSEETLLELIQELDKCEKDNDRLNDLILNKEQIEELYNLAKKLKINRGFISGDLPYENYNKEESKRIK